ncbi:hypothetical protein [Acinetobacter sp. TGL-Y2]|uniref:hypothetical protein n=1 Tax=Acinetobacter sp. TGL-Y2 TaxID=1407071 RepID=UPI001908D2CF|nr:hypothetical protein [Acinetobacter sp. TGL-Y2]MBJ9372292.1 hypothetical protein [Acinetobacter sp. TGL-Y2]
MIKLKRIQLISGLVLSSTLITSVSAYELPAVEKRRANTTDLSVHNAMFLRQGTETSVLGILKKSGKNYELASSDVQRGGSFPIAVHPSLKIDDDLVGKEVRAIGRMTYETMSMPNSIETLYSFKLELYTIEAIR